MKNGQDKTIWKDISGNGNDGKLINFDFDDKSGWIDQGLQLDGVDDYIETSLFPKLNKPFTISINGEFNNITIENWGILRKPVMYPYEFAFYQRDNRFFRFVIWEKHGGAIAQLLIPIEYIYNSKDLTFKSTMNDLSVFLDGNLMQSVNINQNQWNNHTATDRPLEIGVAGHDGKQEHGKFLLKSIKWYSRALTVEEIKQNYEASHFLLEPKTFTSNDYYNYYDLNRVELNTLATKDLAEILREDIDLENIDFDRNMKAFPFADILNKVERNIDKLGNELYKPKNYINPKLDWAPGMPFSYEDANRLERNLQFLYNYAKGNIDSIKYAGEGFVGKGVIF